MANDDPSSTERQIGLPALVADAASEPTSSDLNGGRLLNLIGLVSPVANVAMLKLAPRELRWFGIGAGIVLWAAGGWGRVADVEWALRGSFGLHYVLVVLGLLHPRWPERVGRAWIGFGMLLGKIVAVPLFAALFYLVVTPTALLVRLSGRDPLRRKAEPDESYWQEHKPPGPERFERQF